MARRMITLGRGLALTLLLALWTASGAVAQSAAPAPAPAAGAARAPAAGQPPAGAQLLDGSGVRQTLSGNSTIAMLDLGGRPTSLTIFYDPQGRLQVAGSDGFQDDGMWRVLPDGRYCSRWRRLRRGAESCSAVYRNGADLYFVDEAGRYDAKLMSGNQIRIER